MARDLPPAAAAYVAALDAWLAAGHDRNDTEASRLLDECADHLLEHLPPRPASHVVPKQRDTTIGALLHLLR